MVPAIDSLKKYPFLHLSSRNLLILIMVVHCVLLCAMGLFRHWGYLSNLNDLGFFDQAVWGTLHGQWFLDTNNTYGRAINWLGCHFNPFLIFFVPLYAIWPAAEWFVLAQALALSLAAWPIFILAARVHSSESTGLLWAIIYLLNPFLLNAAAWDFHPVTLAVPMIAWSLLFVERRVFRPLFLCCLSLLLIQEQFGITVAGFGILWWVRHRDWKCGTLLAAIGVLHAILVLGVIMPALSPSGNHNMIDPANRDSRYGWLGSSALDIFRNVLFHPLSVVKTILSMEGTVNYLVLLSLPLLGLFAIAPIWLLPAGADLAANILSTISMPRSIFSYHSVTIVPILIVSAMYGVMKVGPSLRQYLSVPLPNIIVLCTVMFAYIFAPIPLPGAINFWQPVKWAQLPDQALKQIRPLVANYSSVSVQANVGAHLSQHHRVYRYPYKANTVDAIVLRVDSPTLRTDLKMGHGIGSIIHHLQMKPAEYLASVECLLRSSSHGIVLWEEPWLVAARGAGNRQYDELIRSRIVALRKDWQVTDNDFHTAMKTCSDFAGP